MEEKPILIQGAIDIELDYLINVIQNKEEIEIGTYKYYKGLIDGYPVVVSKTKIGQTNAGASTSIAILKYLPILIINQGTAGGHGRKIHKGDIVVGKDYINLTAFRINRREEGSGSDLSGWKMRAFYTDKQHHIYNVADERLLEITRELKDEYNTGKIYEGRIASGEIWNRESDRIMYIYNTYKTLCEEMETGAVYTIAKNFNIPVIGIRVITNNEVLKEIYDNEYAKILATNCQIFVEKVVKECIKNINEFKV